MNILRCENVTKTYQLGQSEVKALDGLNLAIEKALWLLRQAHPGKRVTGKDV